MVPVGQGVPGGAQIVGERGQAEVADGSATWPQLPGAAGGNPLYGKVFDALHGPERRLFPGFVAVALACAAFWPRKHQTTKPAKGAFVVSWFRGDPRGAYLLGLLLAFDISLGFNGFTYPLLYDYIRPFRGLRIPARMGILVAFSLAVLAGYGVARLTERPVRGRRAARSLSCWVSRCWPSTRQDR